MSLIKSILNKYGYHVVHSSVLNVWLVEQLKDKLPLNTPEIYLAEQDVDILSDTEFMALYEKCKHYTMTSIQAMYALYKSTQYMVQTGLEGDVVECGVWRGGSMMMCALTLMGIGAADRNIYLFDTYTGMTKPTEHDVKYDDESALPEWDSSQKECHNEWCYASLDDVKKNLYSTGYPQEKLKFIKGPVEETLPGTLPGNVSILRLDTDWYASTLHELEHLYPLLVKSGVLIVDDYGHWKGQREAVDKYFRNKDVSLLLNRFDHAGRLAIKV